MNDKSWLLNPTAIKCAKLCIVLVREELGVRLTLSHPEFIDMLRNYVELTDSEALEEAFHDLISFAGTSAPQLKANRNVKSVIAPVQTAHANNPTVDVRVVDNEEYIIYKGKSYKRYHNGLEFKGLYRGQARYS